MSAAMPSMNIRWIFATIRNTIICYIFLPVCTNPNPVSLKTIWEEYESQNISLQIAERRFNTLRSMTGLITMAAIALSVTTGERNKWYIILYGLAIVFSLIFFVKSFIDSSKIPQKRQELGRNFQRNYTCPHCGHFLGNQSYDILVQNDHCSYCKTKFIH